MRQTFYDVATSLTDDEYVNTIVVPTRDVIVTLERDEDGDPEQADEVFLRSLGTPERSVVIGPLKRGDADVREDEKTGRLVYTFRNVPFGAWRVAVNVGDDEKGRSAKELILDLVVRKQGVFAGAKKLGPKPPAAPIAPPVVREEEPQPEASAAALGTADQIEMFVVE